MFKQRIPQFFLVLLLTIAFSSTSHAIIIDYTHTFFLTLDSENVYELDTDAYATVSFTIDSSSGNTSAAGLSMHYLAIDPSFSMSLEIGDYTTSGTTYTYDVTSDSSYMAYGYYPSVTLNTSDWSINTIDFTIVDQLSDDDMVILIIEAEEINRNGGSSSEALGLTAGSVATSALEKDGDDNYIIPTDENGNITLAETASGELELVNFGGQPVAANDFSDTTGSEWTTTIPEPATFSLFSLGLFGWAWFGRRRSLE